jgi:dihydrofolate reductase
MRNLIYPINVTLDGCCDHTKFRPDEDTFEYFIRLTRDAGTFLYGRKTYQIMVPYWPDIAKNPAGETQEDVEFAQAFDSMDKIVFSRTLDKVEGSNTRIIRSNLEGEIVKLKQEQGKDILLGGVALPTQLIALGLVDEFIFVVQPIIVGEGRRLMEGISLPEKLRLKLVESKTFKSGSIVLHYLKE